ncbi:hypothetical protein, partial [Providencia sp.]|uniref:hypothetical protein n=1 Tax=Providencia sp. TaxID=589 RepID=UPI0025F62F2D
FDVDTKFNESGRCCEVCILRFSFRKSSSYFQLYLSFFTSYCHRGYFSNLTTEAVCRVSGCAL